MSDRLVHSVSLMGTVVTIEVVGHGTTSDEQVQRREGVERAVEWFREVERCCTRFDSSSELRQLSEHVSEAVAVSELLFQVLQFALALAVETDGAFDPTVGVEMAARGFNRNYRTGEIDQTGRIVQTDAVSASYRDVGVNPTDRTVTLYKPLRLDLGAVAKGFAVDLAARELLPFENFAIDADGDQYFGGRNALGEPWSVGIRDPRNGGALIETIRVSDAAVCTSGDYERVGADGLHHIVDLRAGSRCSPMVASATVIASSAMVADGLATAAFVLGQIDGIALLERHGVRGILVTDTLERFETRA